MITDDKWPVARLIPISSASGVEAQERRLASALLAVMAAVPEFGNALLKPLGAPSGKFETFIEVPFKLEGKPLRPDGVIVVTRAGKSWSALLEAKIAAHPLEPDQINAYLDLARELDFQAVLSVSNQYVTSSTEYPIEIDRRKIRRTKLHHWSWIDLLTQATVQKEYRGISDPDQAYILGELIRYLADPRSGAVAFDGMGGGWTAVRDGAREQTLRKSDAAVIATVARWDDLVRYLALSLTTELGREVKHVLPASERTPNARRQGLTESLVSSGRLYGDLQIPNVAGLLSISTDLRSRQVVASTSIDAPKEGSSKSRVSWLLRQLQAAPENLKIEARIAYKSTSLVASLSAVRENAATLYPEGGREIRGFTLSTASNMGLKRDSSRGSFVESVVSAAEAFYGDVLQKLRAWKPAPPKLKKPAEKDVSPEAAVAELVGVEPDDIAELPTETVERGSASVAAPDPPASGVDDRRR
jgi:hypothetical protein